MKCERTSETEECPAIEILDVNFFPMDVKDTNSKTHGLQDIQANQDATCSGCDDYKQNCETTKET